MKTIVKGVLYDTETATEVAKAYLGRATDPHMIRESLYRTPEGLWFTWGEGGRMSTYEINVHADLWRGSWELRPCTPRQAKGWLEAHRCLFALRRYFTPARPPA